ncbi:efflux RND transporter periplasmic adaptor subunit [Sphingomonas quercus]|uniref:Efflux RND transporter periplasmic adaptor subunit n=1 Tax=Sphingomonas quercus TaxID=2842451 RepID=A0ABS6BLM2_9SPHN|nr:efflux RND transporter periplasmic adaptor subunit [Sphingomonas quercus]MBU3078732.1 efflux RND transporter periplasmic adaptor subunit [Sphingomonas quercus]
MTPHQHLGSALRCTTLALLLALAACGAQQQQDGAGGGGGGGGRNGGGRRGAFVGTPEAGYVVLKRESVALPIELSGRTSAFESSDVRPQVSGVIKARLFEEGSIVKQGQTLYQIDPSLYEAAVSQAKANLANARAAASAARARADRYKPLVEMEAVAQQDYTDAEAAAQQAAAQVQQAQAQLDTANVNLRFTRVPAPITGRVGRSLVTTGALVTNGQTTAMTSIQRLDPMFVDIQQSAADLLALRRALSRDGLTRSSADVKLTLEDGSAYGPTGHVEFAEALVDPATGTVTLRARFPNPQGVLLPGMFVRAHMSQATATEAILVPQAGVARDPRGSATVMLVGPDNKAKLQPITVTQTVGDKWLATSGVKPGDKVIVEGLLNIQPETKIRPVPAGAPPLPPRRQGAGDAGNGAGGNRGGGQRAGGSAG